MLEEIYADRRLLLNFFTPVRKLVGKERVGAKVRKIYDLAQTPYRRVLASERVPEKKKVRLRAAYRELNPVEIRRRLEEKLHQLWGLNG